MVVNLHKISERENTPTRLFNKDAHDLYRILRAVSTDELVAAFERLLTTTGVDRQPNMRWSSSSACSQLDLRRSAQQWPVRQRKASEIRP